MPLIDILILSNGPGEVTTWVLPVVKALRQKLDQDSDRIRISVVLSPCPNATGKETAIAASYPEVDRVLSSEHFFPFLLWGKTSSNWQWSETGIVIFLGGDQLFPLLIASRLAYRTVVYVEWQARWYQWVDRFALMKPSILSKIPEKYHPKCTVVGDLMADMPLTTTLSIDPHTELIGLLPGSKAAKLAQGLPLCLAIANVIHKKRPQTRFIIPVAPTLDLKTLASYADPATNPVIEIIEGLSAELVIGENGQSFLKTAFGLHIDLITEFPASKMLSQCRLCLTTVGANTAQLTALAVPMIVMLPTQQLEAMRSWDGIPGILANLPGLGLYFAKLINWLVSKQGRLFAWPNIWAKEEIVPELVGKLKATDVAAIAINWLENPEKLAKISDRLKSIRQPPGAGEKIAAIVEEILNLTSIKREQSNYYD